MSAILTSPRHDVSTSPARTAISLLLSCGGAAVAAWLLPASAHIVEWSRSGPHRLAVFAPQYLLLAALGLALGAAAALWVAGTPTAEERQRRAAVVAPLAILWIWTVPFLPWLPDRFPLLIVLAGPARWVFAGIALYGTANRALQASLPRRGSPGLPGSSVAAVVSLAIFVGCGWWSFDAVGVAGDEPHYLVIAHSLLADGDLQIENNHAQRDYRMFFSGALRPDYYERGQNGQIYSIHAPGIAALMVPGYALFGARGGLVTIAILSAIGALAVFRLGVAFGGRGAGWLTWLAICATVPVVPHAWSLYPEAATFAVAAWAVWWIVVPAPASWRMWLIRGACVGALPWFHTKMVVLAAGFALLFVWRIRHHRTELVAFVAPAALSGAAWLGFFLVVYGTIDPQAPYGAFTQEFVRIANIPRGVLGLFADGRFGLLPYAPVYLFVPAGAWLLWRDRARRGASFALGLLAALFVLTSARMYMWWGGLSAPARFVVPALPLIAPFLAAAFARGRGRWWYGPLLVSLAISLAISGLALAQMPVRLLFNVRDESSRLFEVVQGSAPLSLAFPTYTQEGWWAASALLLPWVAAVALTLVVGRLAWSLPAIWVTALVCGVFVTTVAVSTGAPPVPAAVSFAERGTLAFIQRFDPERARAFDYRRLVKLAPAEWLQASALVMDAQKTGDESTTSRITNVLALPPGRFEAHVWFAGDRPRNGELNVVAWGGRTVGSLAGPLPNPAVITLDWPLPMPAFWLELTEPAAAAAAVRVEIRAVDIVPAGRRPEIEPVAIEPIGQRPGAFLAYADRQIYPEGGVFWTASTRTGVVWVVPAGAREMVLTVHVGPTGGTVRLTADDISREVTLPPDGSQQETFQLRDGTRFVRLAVQSSHAFRPADVDASSSDTRGLGAQVRVELRP